MVPVIVWLVLLVLLILGEIATVSLTSIWFAVGALGGLIVAFFHGSVFLQILVFLVLSALSLFLVRPLFKDFMKTSISPTNADRIIGKTAVVTETIDNVAAQGQISVAGQVWTARSEHGVVIPTDSQVKILRIEGVKVFVEAV